MADRGAAPTAGARGSGAEEHYRLRWYVAGQTSKSSSAIANLQRICEQHLEGRYTIEVIDLIERPQPARGEEILAIPTLVRQLPTPMRTIIGDLSDTDRVVLVGLQIVPVSGAAGSPDGS